MIDIESKVYTPIAQELRLAGVNVSGEYVNAPSKFPHASIVETDNYSVEMDSSDTETFAMIMYEVNVYSNKGNAKKSECKSIMDTISQRMYSLNFVRIACTPVPNLENASIYRMTARFRAVTDGTNIYRRTI